MQIDKQSGGSGVTLATPNNGNLIYGDLLAHPIMASSCESIKNGRCWDEYGRCVLNCSDPAARGRGIARRLKKATLETGVLAGRGRLQDAP